MSSVLEVSGVNLIQICNGSEWCKTKWLNYKLNKKDFDFSNSVCVIEWSNCLSLCNELLEVTDSLRSAVHVISLLLLFYIYLLSNLVNNNFLLTFAHYVNSIIWHTTVRSSSWQVCIIVLKPGQDTEQYQYGDQNVCFSHVQCQWMWN